MGMHRLFTEHPSSVGETYLEHLMNASRFAACMIAAGAACLVHAVLPFLFAHTASRTIDELHQRMIVVRRAGGRTPSMRDGSTAS